MVGERTHPFVLPLTNPIYDPIQSWLNVLWSPLPTTTTTVPTDKSGVTPRPVKRRPPFAITPPTFTFSVTASAEAGDYYDEGGDDMVEDVVDKRTTFAAVT